MEYTTCYDSVMELVNKESEECGEGYKPGEKYGKLKEICSAVDEFIKALDCVCDFVTVNVTTLKHVTFDIGCEEIAFQRDAVMLADNPSELGGKESKKFYRCVSMMDSVSFYKTPSDRLQITFELKDVWERAK